MSGDDLWVDVPGGVYPIGAQRDDPAAPGYDPAALPREAPPWTAHLAPFRLARLPVTVRGFAAFMDAGGYGDPAWWPAGGRGAASEPEAWAAQRERPDHPVVGVSWYEAMAYAAWRGATLPTEAQWEAAARGPAGRRFPWGDEDPAPARLNAIESGLAGTSPAGAHPAGATPEGILDLAGNVWEWCRDGFGPYTLPARPGDGAREAGPDAPRPFRGGCFAARAVYTRCAMRAWGAPHQRFRRRGFRLARPIP